MNFTEAENLVNVALYGCQPPSLIIPLPPPPPPLPPPPSQRPLIPIGLNGSDTSFIALVVSEEDVLRGYGHVSVCVNVHTNSSLQLDHTQHGRSIIGLASLNYL